MDGISLSDQIVTARKIHFCEFCRLEIPKGTKYRKWCWIDGGTALTIKTHRLCCEIAQDGLDPTEAFEVSWESIWYSLDNITLEEAIERYGKIDLELIKILWNSANE